MHGVAIFPDGTKDGIKMEFWFSAARGVKGAKIGGAPCWEDYGDEDANILRFPEESDRSRTRGPFRGVRSVLHGGS